MDENLFSLLEEFAAFHVGYVFKARFYQLGFFFEVSSCSTGVFVALEII